MEHLEIYIEENQDMLYKLLWELCHIPAPSHHEEKRAEFCRRWLEEQGAKGVFIDDALNVIYPYACDKHKEAVLFMAHMDTVFPDMELMDVQVRDGKLFAPGAGDDTANVAILLMIARYFAIYTPKTSYGVIFAANSCEEGLGNLKGSIALVKRYQKRLRQVVSFDGYIDEICNCAVGSMRYQVEVKTEGGHSYFDFGRPNAIVYLSHIIEEIYRYQVPEDGSKTTYNVGCISGGTSVNSIAGQAGMLYEFRSDSRDSMRIVKKDFEELIEKFRQAGTEVTVELVGERPCGVKDSKNPKQKALEELCQNVIWKRTGRLPGFTSASTDCNIPFSLGIPAATIGLCTGGGAHTRQEWILIDSLKDGFGIAADIILAAATSRVYEKATVT